MESGADFAMACRARWRVACHWRGPAFFSTPQGDEMPVLFLLLRKTEIPPTEKVFGWLKTRGDAR